MKRKPEEDVMMAIEMYTLCKEFHVLPDTGGLLDQDYRNIIRLKHVASAVAEKRELDMKNAATKK